MPHQRGDQTIELATGQQHVPAAERPYHPLANAAAQALVLDETKIRYVPALFSRGKLSKRYLTIRRPQQEQLPILLENFPQHH
jgi:hypothetical protein